MASVMFNTKLNKYFIDNVQMKREETSRIVADVMPDIKDIVKCISDVDSRFGAEAKHIGSYYQGLKVKRADEFDLSIPLTDLGQQCWSKDVRPMRFGFDKPEYNDKPTVNQELSIVPSQNFLERPGREYISSRLTGSIALKYKELMFGEFLIPFLVKLRMKVLLHKALTGLQLRGHIKVDRVVHGPALTLKIEYKKRGSEIITVNVDFAAVICAKLTFPEYTNWLERAQLRGWPSRSKINEINSKGINVVAKHNFFWQVSFAECEKTLVHDMDADGCIRKKVHRIIKSLYKEICKSNEHPELSSYMLKNAWLLECERYPDPACWQPVRLGERFVRCIQHLEEFIARGNLPQYFCFEVNLLKDKDLDKIRQLLEKLKKQADNIGEAN